MTPYAKASDQYLVQRVMGASPLQLVILLLEGGQRFLAQAMQALERKDYAAKANHTNRVLAILDELTSRLDPETGGELAQNLLGLHAWWSREIVEASMSKDGARLSRIHRQMGELRQAWEQLDRQGAGGHEPAEFQIRDMVG